MTNLDVQKALGRAPSETYEDGAYTVEVYSYDCSL